MRRGLISLAGGVVAPRSGPGNNNHKGANFRNFPVNNFLAICVKGGGGVW